jgi:peptide/nickel transport system ATP-binding protein
MSNSSEGSVSMAASTAALVKVRGLRKHFHQKGGFAQPAATIRAVEDISFDVMAGETLGVVGESGCGKSTAARLMLQLVQPDAGDITFDGHPIGSKALPMRQFRRQAQMVFQDSHSSLNPRLTIEDSVAFAPIVHGVSRSEARGKARRVLSDVGLAADRFADRYPHELSGGQRQRVNIARALVIDPRLVVFDEAVSALDKSIEAQVLALIQELKTRLGLTYVFISHDLNVVQHVSDRVMIMYLGKVVEIGDVRDIYRTPRHPYTKALLASRPSMDPERRTEAVPLAGDPPNPINPPSGCRFRTRCPMAMEVCSRVEPSLSPLIGGTGHQVACHAVPDRILDGAL